MYAQVAAGEIAAAAPRNRAACVDVPRPGADIDRFRHRKSKSIGTERNKRRNQSPMISGLVTARRLCNGTKAET